MMQKSSVQEQRIWIWRKSVVEKKIKIRGMGKSSSKITTTTTSRNRRPWEDLPHHILELFLKPIPEPIDRPNLSRVCKAWRDFKPLLQSSLCFPALVHGPTVSKFIKVGGLDDDDEYVIRSCVGSSHGWLIIRMKKTCYHPEERFYLLNIYTKDTIQLPFLWDYYLGWPEIGLSCSPTNPDCIVVMFDATIKGFLFSKRGWNKWIESDCKYPLYSNSNSNSKPTEYSTRIYHAFPFQGKLYALTHRGNLAIINVNVGDPTTTKLTLLPVNSIYPTPITCEWIQSLTLGYTRISYDWFLTESLGKLLAVRLYRREKYEEIINLDVLELDFKTMSWIKVNNLPGGGDQVLFISLFSSFSISGSEMGIGGNCIYVSDRLLGRIHRYDMHNQEMIVCTEYPRGDYDSFKREFTMLDYRRLWVKPTFV